MAANWLLPAAFQAGAPAFPGTAGGAATWADASPAPPSPLPAPPPRPEPAGGASRGSEGEARIPFTCRLTPRGPFSTFRSLALAGRTLFLLHQWKCFYLVKKIL